MVRSRGDYRHSQRVRGEVLTNKHTEGFYKAAYVWFKALDDGKKPSNYWAHVFGVDWKTIERWREGGKTIRYRVDPALLARAEEMLKAGATFAEASRATGISDVAIGKRFKQYRKRKPIDFAKALLEDGASYAEVERSTGIPIRDLKEKYPGHEWTLDDVIDLNRSIHNAKKKMPGHYRGIFFGP